MSVFRCKMCGGALDIQPGQTVVQCDYCGTNQTLPKLDDEKRTNLYDRANHFRRNNEFDKAMGIYEKILNEDNTDAESYWSLVLCRYGIEYVEDPATHKRVPTVNRAQFTSIFDDDNYKSALQYADAYQRSIYEAEAKAINEIQKGILAISQKEDPFDVFICYKETDHNGRRTPDSVLANDLYHQLTQEGFKVFFSRITLEDKLGSAYEPYIFAALNSAKVMVVLGTKPEYFSAVWVKNEWSRYLSLIRQGQRKMLIPAYKDMDPYDLPEEFSHLQAQDMGKLGFMQDLIRGIRKIAQAEEPKPTVVKETVISTGNANIAALMRRAQMFLEDGDWDSADEYCEKVLDIDPENGEAYLSKALSQMHCATLEEFVDTRLRETEKATGENLTLEPDRAHIDSVVEKLTLEPYLAGSRIEKLYEFDLHYVSCVSARRQHYAVEKAEWECDKYLLRAEQFADPALRQSLAGAKQRLLTTLEQRLTAAEEEKKEAIEDLRRRYAAFLREADKKAVQLHTEAQAIQEKDCRQWLEEARTSSSRYIINEKKTRFAQMGREDCVDFCNRRLAELDAEDEAVQERYRKQAEEHARKRKRRRNACILLILVLLLVMAGIYAAVNYVIPELNYRKAVEKMGAGEYEQAIAAFEASGGYKDSAAQINNCNMFILDGKYDAALTLMETGNVVEAYETLIALDGYKDSTEKANSIYDAYKPLKLKCAQVGDYVFFGSYEQDNDKSNGKEDIEWLVLEIKDGKALVISKYVLDCQRYNTEQTSVTWETCSLRQWLNKDFLNAAFSAEEQAMIPTVTVSADNNPNYSTDPGKATQDKVFLLSIQEANEYFASDSARLCMATDYAVANGARGNSVNGSCWWWLRSPGTDQTHAAIVLYGGGIGESGSNVISGIDAVRPAMWIDLNA